MGLFLIWFWLFVFEIVATCIINKQWPSGEMIFIAIVSSSITTLLIFGVWQTIVYFL